MNDLEKTSPSAKRAVSKASILIVDDEASARSGLQKLLALEGYQTFTAEGGELALKVLDEHPVDVIVTDLRMPRMTGNQLLALVKQRHPATAVIIVTAFGDVNSAVVAMREGAEDFLTKPVDVDLLLLTIERVLERRNLKLETENLRRQAREKQEEGLIGLVGSSAAMQSVYRYARQIAPSRATILITGESGTGKGEAARAIHALSPRQDKPFITLQCSALAESLLESELFGHEKGAFTGADKRRIGRFEQAAGGTLFLDEIGEVPPGTQVKLLRVLQERTFERVGGNEAIHVDVRLVAATNKNLLEEVERGRFREDLYYRLNVIRLEMPPLRSRGGDVLLLAGHFLRKYAEENHKRAPTLTDTAKARLLSHHWPGNVRELENAIERAVVLSQSDQVDAPDLPADIGHARNSADHVSIPGSKIADIERYAILKTLEATDWSTSRAADMLGISIRTIQYRLSEYGVNAKDLRR